MFFLSCVFLRNHNAWIYEIQLILRYACGDSRGAVNVGNERRNRVGGCEERADSARD